MSNVNAKWEYCLEILGVSHLEHPQKHDAWESAIESLNESGRQGWEAVGIISGAVRMENGEPSEPLVLMKRALPMK